MRKYFNKIVYWIKNMLVFITFLTGVVLYSKGIIDGERFSALVITCLFAGFNLEKYLS